MRGACCDIDSVGNISTIVELKAFYFLNFVIENKIIEAQKLGVELYNNKRELLDNNSLHNLIDWVENYR